MHAHNITITAMSKPEEDHNAIKKAFLSLIPFDTEKEKISISETTCMGFNERKIKLIQAVLEKPRHTSLFLKNLSQHLSQSQKKQLIAQKHSRLDAENNFFIRLDKESLIKQKDFKITDSGICFHIKIKIAAFPSTRETALKAIDEILNIT